MKNLLVKGISLSIILILAGCGLAIPMREVRLPTQEIGQPASDSSLYRVVLFNDSNALLYGPDSSGLSNSGHINVYLDQKAVGQLDIGDYVVVEASPGEHTIDLVHRDAIEFKSSHRIQINKNEQYIKIYAKIISNGAEVVSKPDDFEKNFRPALIPMSYSRLEEVQLPPQRITQKGYSLVPLDEKGWVFTIRDQYNLGLTKYGKSPDETLALQGNLIMLSVPMIGEEFVQQVKDAQIKDTDPQRFKVLKHDITAYEGKGADCAKSHMVTEDHMVVRRSNRKGHMVLELFTLTCVRTEDRSVMVNVTYSHRYDPGQEDPRFVEKATSILDSIEFAEL